MPQGLDHEMIQNAILYAGQPEIQEMEVLTGTDFCPGRLVIADTAVYQCQVAGAGSLLVLGVADVPSDKKLSWYWAAPANGEGDPAHDFEAKDQIRVLRGDIVVKLVAVSGATINVGTRVYPSTIGMVTNTVVSGGTIGYSLEKKGTLAKADWVLVKLTI